VGLDTWEYLDPSTGTFGGRWDEPAGNFRTVHCATELLARLLEVLARFRPDPILFEELDRIEVDPHDAEHHPTALPGSVPRDWLKPRTATSGRLRGIYCSVTDKQSLPTLRRKFVSTALHHHLPDLDAGTLRLSAPRALTQQIAAWLHRTAVDPHDRLDGVEFESRHGDRLTLYAVFEQPDDPAVSPRITAGRDIELHPEHADLLEAFRLHGLTWGP
jgi:hypothetical protein